MLFVFGYRANKIRCKKLSVLIHKSSAHENVSSCSVAVHFAQIVDKDDGSYEFVQNSAFVISRTAFRDNSSYYTINNRRVHFKEVAKMLKQHLVDLDHNRFLILQVSVSALVCVEWNAGEFNFCLPIQGEVESIAMMKPKGASESECGLLEYLEDIVGTTRYKVSFPVLFCVNEHPVLTVHTVSGTTSKDQRSRGSVNRREYGQAQSLQNGPT